MLKCSTCLDDKPTTSFSKKANTKRGYSYVCKDCHNIYVRTKWYVNNRQKQIKSSSDWRIKNQFIFLANSYKLDAGLIERVYKEANGRCQLCGKKRKLVLDHCHETGVLRGFICMSCNSGLGHLGDNKDSLLLAVEYLDRCPT